MPRLSLIGCPFDSGVSDWRMGRGPLAILADFAHVSWVPEPEPDLTETARVFQVADATAHLVREVPDFPVVVSGNCSAALAQVGRADSAVWLDAHADFNTPDTTRSGFLDGMALSMVCGDAWKTCCESVRGFAPLDPGRVMLVGARDLEPAEQDRIGRTGILRPPVAEVEASSDRMYLHIDLDVLDPEQVGAANQFACPGGLAVDDVLAVIERLRPALAGVSLTAYDPAFDSSGAVLGAARRILACLAR